MTIDPDPSRIGATTGPASTSLPDRPPRRASRPRSPARLFRAAVSRLAVTVPSGADGRTLGRGGPVMTVRRPDEFFARLGRDA